MESSYILCLLPTRWQCFKHWMDIPFRTGALCLYIPSKSPATPGRLEGAVWLLHNSISNLLFFTSAAPRVGTTPALDPWVVPTLIRGTCFNPSLGPQTWLGQDGHQPLGKSPPPGPGAAHQLGQGCHQGSGPSNTAQGVPQPFCLCSLRAWRFCIPGRLADWHQENQVCMASEAVGISSRGLPSPGRTTCQSSYPIRTQSGEWQQEWSRTKVTLPSLGMLMRSWEDCVGNDRWMKQEYKASLRSSRGHRWLC